MGQGSRRWTATWIGVAVVAGGLAGCLQAEGSSQATGGKKASPSAVPPTPGLETGSLSGVVVTEEQQPIPNAQIGLVGPGLETKTDAGGRFTFNELEPGAYQVLVERLGYKPASRQVDVLVGEVTEVTFVLDPLVVDREWVQMEKVSRAVASGNFVWLYPNDVQTWSGTWAVKDKAAALVDAFFELAWAPSTPLGDGIRFLAGTPTYGGTAVCGSSGNNPYTCRTAPDKIAQEWPCDKTIEDDCRIGYMFRPGGSRLSSGYVGLWPSETINVYASFFYRAPMPDNYQARPPS